MKILERLKKHRVWHPFLFSLYIVLSPLSQNIFNVDVNIIRPLFASLLVALLLVVAFKIVLKDSIKAGLLSSGLILLLFSYGHVKNVLEFNPVLAWMSRDVILVVVWIAIAAGWAYWVLKKSRQPQTVSIYLNWVSLILIVFPVYTLWVYFQKGGADTIIQQYVSELQSANTALHTEYAFTGDASQKPDIYYIILDGYAREDMLAELYGYDNSGFIEALADRGFIVTEQSEANYLKTILSLSSSLNMTHINSMPEAFPASYNNDKRWWAIRQTANELIGNNAVGEILKDQGYTYVVFSGGNEGVRVFNADQTPSPPGVRDTSYFDFSFEFMLLDTSLGKLINRLRGEEEPYKALLDDHRARIRYFLEHIPDYAADEGSYFVFAHIVCPHYPYVFGPNGEPISSDDPYTLLDTNPPSKERTQRYTDQLHYLNTLVMDTVDQILSNSSTPPIIILQADHGSRVYFQVDRTTQVAYQLNVPILNAYYLPGVDPRSIPQSITPVNSFRLILNLYFGGELELLPDTSYALSTKDGQLDFFEACALFEACEGE